MQLVNFVKSYEPGQIIEILNKAKGAYEYNAYTQQRQNQVVLDIVLTQLQSQKETLANISEEQLLNYRLESISTIFSAIYSVDA